MKAILKEDLRSGDRKETYYAKKGDKVTILKWFGDVAICLKGRSRFPAHKDKLEVFKKKGTDA